MPRYRITNNVTGVELGVYKGAHEDDALDAFARDCSYDDFADMCEGTPTLSADIDVTYVGD